MNSFHYIFFLRNMNLVIILSYYFILIPIIIFAALLTSLYLYWKFNYENSSDQISFYQNDDHQTNRPSSSNDNSSPSPSSSASSSTTKFNDRIVMTKEIDKLLCKIVDNIVEYYVMTWYRPLIISSSYSLHDTDCQYYQHNVRKQLVQRLHTLLRDDIWILLSCFIDRLYNVNHVQFISQDLVKRLRNHFQNISHNHNRKDDDGNGNEISASPLVESWLGHRKNQHSISSIMTNVSQSSSSSDDDDDCESDISCSASQTNLDSPTLPNDDNRPILMKSKFSSFISNSNSKTQQLLQNLNPFLKTTDSPFANVSESQVNNDDDDDYNVEKQVIGPIQSKLSAATKATIIYPLASHLADVDSEKNLIENLASFILTTLLNDINRGYQNQFSPSSSTYESSKLLLIQNCQTIRSFLNEILAKILYDTIDLITQPKMINYQIVKILKKYFLLKDILFYDTIQQQSDNNNNQDLKQPTELDDNYEDFVSGSDSYDDDDDDDDDGKNDEYLGGRKNIFILNEAKQCIMANDFDHLYELIDKCNNVKLLKHIRLKLIAEILDAAVVSHLDHHHRMINTIDEKRGFSRQQQQQQQQHRSTTNDIYQSSSDPRECFTFNGQINLKFKNLNKKKILNV
nr:uncharacterized protein LOC124494313 [Dermatophagoides farinae]